jgi:hypothetical protein
MVVGIGRGVDVTSDRGSVYLALPAGCRSGAVSP